MDNTDNALRPPDPETVGEAQPIVEPHLEATRMATPPKSPNSPSLSSSTMLGFLSNPILKTRISENAKLAPTAKDSEDLEQDVFQRFFQSRASNTETEDASNVKQESTEGGLIKVEQSSDSGNGLFVSQDATPPPMTLTSDLKRKLPLPELEPEQTTSKRQKNGKGKNKNKIEPYDEQEKQSSTLAVDKECYEKAEKLSVAVTNDLLSNIDALCKSGEAEREVGKLREEIKKAGSRNERYVGSWTVGLLGDTASGKSSLINSLLNEDEVAAASDDGESGTHVIHEFVMSEPSQTTKFRAVIHFHPRKKIASLVKEHFANYYNFHHCSGEDLDEQDHEELRMKSNTARDFFLSLIGVSGAKTIWRNAQEAEQCLAFANSATDERVIPVLQEAIEAYMDSLQLKDGTVTVEANTIRELVDRKRQYAGPVKGETQGNGLKRSPWRLVRMINIHLSARILADGLRLADLPGLSDSDQTRVQSSRQYIKSCNSVIVVHPIPRVASSDTVEKNLAYCMRTGKGSNTVLVCTKTDDFNHDRDRALSKTDADFLADLRRKEQDIQNEIIRLEADRDNAEEEGDDGAYARASIALGNKNYEKVIATARILSANISFRNNVVVESMQDKIRSMRAQYADEEGEDVQIFCVSNNVYNTHRKGYDKMKPPEMTAEGTGIPQLRAHLLSEPAKEKHKKLKQVCLRNLPNAVLRLEIYCSRSRLERKKDMLSFVEEPIADVPTHISKTVESLKFLSGEFLEDLSGSNDFSWRREAEVKLKGWEKVHWQRFKGLCAKNGKGKLEKYGDVVDLNEEIFNIVGKQLIKALKQLRKTVAEQVKELQEVFDGLLSDIVKYLKGGAHAVGMDDVMETFFQAVDYKRDLVRSRTQGLTKSLTGKLSLVRHDATSFDDPEQSYVLRSMIETYAEGAQIQGKGSHKARLAAFKTKLTGPDNVFKVVLSDAAAAFQDCVDEWAVEAKDELGKLFGEVITDFHSRFNNEEAEDESRKAFREKLLMVVQEAQEKLKGPLKAEIEECGKYE